MSFSLILTHQFWPGGEKEDVRVLQTFDAQPCTATSNLELGVSSCQKPLPYTLLVRQSASLSLFAGGQNFSSYAPLPSELRAISIQVQ